MEKLVNFRNGGLFVKLIYSFWLIIIIIARKFKKNISEDTNFSKKFVKFNNKRTIMKVSKKNIARRDIVILLPHCIQEDKCSIKVTSEINKCKECGKCEIGDICRLLEKYSIKAKVATGGTLARKFIISSKARVVIAIACERDLVSGIYDAYPMPVYGIFNKQVNGPCYNTKIDVDKIEKAIKLILGAEII